MKIKDFRESIATNLIPKSIEEKFNNLQLQQEESNKPLLARRLLTKYFNPYGVGDWLILEAEKVNDDYILFGYCHLGDDDMAEFGYVYLSELQELRCPPFGLGIERDLYINQDCTMYHVMKQKDFPIKFGLEEYYQYMYEKYEITSFAKEYSNSTIGTQLDKIMKDKKLVKYPDGLYNVLSKSENEKEDFTLIYSYNHSDLSTIIYNLYVNLRKEKKEELYQSIDKDIEEIMSEYEQILDLGIELNQLSKHNKESLLKEFEDEINDEFDKQSTMSL